MVLDDLDNRVMQSISKCIHEYVQEAGFDAFALYEDDRYIGFLKNEWKGANGELRTLFQFWGEGEGFDDYWWVNILPGETTGILTGFYFYIANEWVKNKKPQWRELVKSIFTEKELVKDGFRLNQDGTAIVYPVSFDMRDLLAMLPEKEGEGLPKDAPCFARIKEVLGKIVDRKNVFDELAQKALDLNK